MRPLMLGPVELEALVKANPKNANAYLHLAGVYKKAEQFDKAREVLQQALEPTGNSFEITQEMLDRISAHVC